MVAAAMAIFCLKSASDTPVLKDADQVWMKEKEERKALLDELCMHKFISPSFGATSRNYVHLADDGVSNYSIKLLRMGCLYLRFSDPIREGDGERVI